MSTVVNTPVSSTVTPAASAASAASAADSTEIASNFTTFLQLADDATAESRPAQSDGH